MGDGVNMGGGVHQEGHIHAAAGGASSGVGVHPGG